METQEFRLTIHMVSSVDGYIAAKDNSMSWFETTDNYEAGQTISDAGIAEFLKTIDCYVMGYNTYAQALRLSQSSRWVYGNTPVVVLTHRNLPVGAGTVQSYAGDLRALVEDRLKPHYRNVWMVGGATLANEFIRLDLADEIRQSILPIMLGDGLPFYLAAATERLLHLRNVAAYKNGMVELHYDVLPTRRDEA